MLDNDMLLLNINKYDYFMNHLNNNRNETYLNFSPIFTPISYTKEIPLDLYLLQNNDFTIMLKINPLFNTTNENIIDFPFLKYSEIVNIISEFYPNFDFINEWVLNRFFTLDIFKEYNIINSHNEQYYEIKILNDNKKKVQFRKLTEDLNNFIINKYNMTDDDRQIYGDFLDDFDFNIKYAFSEPKNFDFDMFIQTQNGSISNYNQEGLKQQLYDRIKQKMSFDFIINKNNIKLNMNIERKNKRRSSNKNETKFFTFFNQYDINGKPKRIVIVYISFENDLLNDYLLNDYMESVNNQFIILNSSDEQESSFDIQTKLRINNNVNIKIIDYVEGTEHYYFKDGSKEFAIYDQWDIELKDFEGNDLSDEFYYKELIIPYEQIIKEKITPNNKVNILNRKLKSEQYFDVHKDKRKVCILK